MTPKDVIIVGARGLGKDLLGYIETAGEFHVVCFLDELPVAEVLGYPVVSPKDYRGSCRNAFLAVGYPADKVEVVERYRSLDLQWQTYVDPRAHVSHHARIGEGCLIAPFAHVGSGSSIGRFVLVARYASLGHDAAVEEFASLMPKACVCGGASVGARTLVAVGADILPGIGVGPDCRISAGTTVARPVAAGAIVAESREARAVRARSSGAGGPS
jgi:sugar O-acyltransferase (sialic acid O-acetyltransferase NeuD family)